MRKNKLFIISFVLMIAAFVTIGLARPVNVANADIVYIEIASIEDLALIGNDAGYPLNGNYQLTADLDYETAPDFFADFVPIGTILEGETGPVSMIQDFSGIFDGNGFKIKNIKLEEKTYDYFNIGLFASLNGAHIKNVGIENFYVDRDDVFPDVATNNTGLYVGGIAAKSQNSVIETSYVNFLQETQSEVIGTISTYFGGVVAKAYAGTQIKNSYANVSFKTQISGEQASEIKQGGIVGWLDNSSVSNCHVSGKIEAYVNTSSELDPITEVVSGGVAGFVSSQASVINGVYIDMVVYGETTNQNITPLTGAFVGQISTSIASTPTANNLAYAQMNVNTLSFDGENYVEASLNQIFGQINNYDMTGSNLNLLTQNNFEVFNNAGLWSPYQNYVWNFNTVWTNNSSALPTLQIFNYYQIDLNQDETRVNLGEGSTQVQTVMLDFVTPQEDGYKNGETIQVVVAIINGYDVYYDLESIEFDLQSTVYFGQYNADYTLIQLTEEYEGYDVTSVESTKVYMLSYEISDQTQGDISVSLSKVSFELTVETESQTMGLVRKRDSSVALAIFKQDIQNANSYDFFAIPQNTDFAFSYWRIERPAEEGVEPEVIELGSYAEYAQISFVFGLGGQEDITEEILNGSTLVAVFTSNVTKVTLSNQTNGGEETQEAGYISYTVEGEALDTTQIHSYEKNDSVTLVANANDGYEFVGWYDSDNRLLSNQTTFNFIPTEDNQAISARYNQVGTTASLTWLWITLGVVGTVGLGVGLFFIIRSRSGDSSYRNFY